MAHDGTENFSPILPFLHLSQWLICPRRSCRDPEHVRHVFPGVDEAGADEAAGAGPGEERSPAAGVQRSASAHRLHPRHLRLVLSAQLSLHDHTGPRGGAEGRCACGDELSAHSALRLIRVLTGMPFFETLSFERLLILKSFYCFRNAIISIMWEEKLRFWH